MHRHPGEGVSSDVGLHRQAVGRKRFSVVGIDNSAARSPQDRLTLWPLVNT